MRISPIDSLNASTSNGRNFNSRVAIQYGSGRRKLLELHPLVGQRRGAHRIEFVFPSDKNLISGTSNRGSKKEKPMQQSRESECTKSHSVWF